MLVFGAAALLLVLAPLGGPVRAEPGSPRGARPAVALAAPHPRSIDLQPESVQASVGLPVTLGVRIYDASGALYAGEGTSIFVRVVFLPGSANDPGAAQSFHLSCRTGDTGKCSVTYTPRQAGRDVLCARTGGGRGACDEAVGAPEQDDLIDVVRVIVRAAGPAAPTAAPATAAPATPAPATAVPTVTAAPTKKSPAPTRSPAAPRRTPAPTPDTPAPASTPRAHSTPAPDPAGPGPTSSPILVAGGGGSRPSATPGGGPAGVGSSGSGGSPAPRATDGLGAAASFAGSLVKPEAAAAVATSFGFPIALMVAVVLFLLLQPRLDERDPKLRAAPRSYSDLLVPFEREIDL